MRSKQQRLEQPRTSEPWASSTSAVPERDHRHSRYAGPVIEVVTNPRKVDATDACEPRVLGASTDARLRGDQIEGARKLFSDCSGCCRLVGGRPLPRLDDLPGRAASYPDRQPLAHPRGLSFVKTSAPSTSSPRSASAMAASSAPSSEGPSSKVSASSQARIVTVAPSSSGGPSTTILPATTLPVEMRMRAKLHSLTPDDNAVRHRRAR